MKIRPQRVLDAGAPGGGKKGKGKGEKEKEKGEEKGRIEYN